MKTLILIRHAKSSWDRATTDVLRPLSARGISDANLLSNEMLKKKISLNAVFSSPAIRALSTCMIFMDTFKLSSELLSITDQLYDFGGEKVIKFVRNIDDANQSIMIFGHNDAFTVVANTFGNIFIENVPTCGLVMIQFDTDHWKDVVKGKTIMTLFPKHLE